MTINQDIAWDFPLKFSLEMSITKHDFSYFLSVTSHVEMKHLLSITWQRYGQLMPMMRKQPHSFSFNHCVISNLTRMSLEAS